MFRRRIWLVPALFHDGCRIAASSQKSGKCRMRETGILRHLFEISDYAFRFGGTPEPGGDRLDSGSQSFRSGGRHRQNETSQDHAQPKRGQPLDLLM
jgi:hypothetical protein